MNYKMIGRFLAQILAIECGFMTPSLVISLCQGNIPAVTGFAVSMGIILTLAGSLFFLCKSAPSAFHAKEGLLCVSISWIVLSLLGCLPFVISGEIPNYVDALFEIVSGFTTTGASILTNVEGLSQGMLYWRSFSHWLGGMGVLVFLLAIAPSGKQGSGFTMHLLRAESPGPDVGKLVPKMKNTAVILYILYVVLTIINFLFLIAGKMPIFDALCTAFGTAGTGGFGIKNDSMASYSPYIQNVTTIFMALFGINFSCFYLMILRQFKAIIKDEELQIYVLIFVVSISLIVLDLRGYYGSIAETIRHAAFQVSSIITTTGFATTDFDLWPSFSKTILVALMLIGACAGSTGGGLKIGRLMLLVKHLGRNILQTIQPKKIQAVRINGRVIGEKVLDNADAYIAAYLIIIVVSVLLISLDDYSMTTNLTAVIACFNNIGPGLEAVGPTANFSGYSMFSKLVLIFDMLAGRLEIFPILVLCNYNTWKRR